MSQSQPTPAERFAGLLRILQQAVADRLRGGVLTVPMVVLICDRIGLIVGRFTRLAARIGAGTYRPRRPYTRKPPTNPKPRKPDPLPRTVGWLVPLVPWVPLFPHTAITCRSNLACLFDDPEMQALMAAAPAEMGRILRPLCWMLDLKPPPILARPPRRAPPPPAVRPEPQAAAARSAPPPPLPDPLPTAPASCAPAPSVPPQCCGPPHRP